MSQGLRRSHFAVRTSILLLCSLFLLAAGQCPSDGNGNDNDNGNQNSNTNGNQNANSNGNVNNNGSATAPASNEIWIQFNTTAGDDEVARALSGAVVEYALFGEKDMNGQATVVDQIDLQLPQNLAARAALDVDNPGRPNSILANDDSAVFFDYDESGLAVDVTYVDVSGLTTLESFTLQAVSAGAQAGSIFCDQLIVDLQSVLDQTFADCSGDTDVPRCSGTILEVVNALQEFCTFTQTQVQGVLPSGTGVAPSLSLPLGVVVTSPQSTVAPDEGVTLRGTTFGGSAPYQFTWAVVDGPVLGVRVFSNNTGSLSTASVTFPAEGLYTVRLTIIDNSAQIAYFNLPFSVAGDPGELNLVITSQISEDDPFMATLTATPSGGAPPYEYEWSLVDGPGAVDLSATTLAVTNATFDSAGTYIFEANVVDAVDATDTASHAVTIVDPATSLVASIDIPSGTSCASEDIGDACIDFGDAISFDVTLTNQEADDDDLEYTWTITPPSGQSPSFSDNPSITLDTSQAGSDIPGTWIITVSVTDPDKEETASDQIVLQVQETGDLSVVILGDAVGKIDVAQTLIVQVDGFIGGLTYAWALNGDSEAFGTFDNPALQTVQLTPSTVGTLSIDVTVTDSEVPGSPATATFDIIITPFDITGIDGPCDYDTATNTGTCTFMSLTLTDVGVVLTSDAPDDVDFEWTLGLVDPDDTLSAVILPESADTQDIQLLTTGDGQLTLSVMVTDPSDDNNLSSAQLLVTSECLAADEPTALALIDDGTMDGATAILARPDDEVVLDCISDAADDSGRSFRWRRLDNLSGGFTFDFDTDFMHDDDEIGDASFTMPEATAVIAGGLTFDCVVTNDLSACDETSDSLVVYFDPQLLELEDQMVEAGELVEVQCMVEVGSDSSLEWSEVSDTGISFTDDGMGGLSFTAPAGPVDLTFECLPSIEAPDGTMLIGTSEEVTISVE